MSRDNLILSNSIGTSIVHIGVTQSVLLGSTERARGEESCKMILLSIMMMLRRGLLWLHQHQGNR